MLQVRVFFVIVLLSIWAPFIEAQELHEWKSKTGHSTKAAFLKIDEAKRKVTLLVQKEVDFDSLEKDSLDLALALAKSSSVSPEKVRKPLSSQEIAISSTVKMKLIFVPQGGFLMGSPENEEGRMENENQVKVEVSDFYIGQTEVTQGQWYELMQSEPWKGQQYVKEGSDYPATWVDWYDANAFCESLSNKVNKKCRLPTEAEWEYSCRAGTATPFGLDANGKLSDFAWWGSFVLGGSSNNFKHANKVAVKRPNKNNLHDMHGNVWEWCSDWSSDQLTGGSNPQGPDIGFKKIMRGGSWTNKPMDCRAAYRPSVVPTDKFNALGFRILVEAN